MAELLFSETTQMTINHLSDGTQQFISPSGQHFTLTPATEEIIHDLPIDSVLEFIAISVFLVILGGISSGLNVSLLSIDQFKIDLLKKSSKPVDKKIVKRLAPILKNKHLLLVTLLVANAAGLYLFLLFSPPLFPLFFVLASDARKKGAFRVAPFFVYPLPSFSL